MLLDLSAGPQRYVEDCEVCCNPIEISFDTEEGRMASFEALWATQKGAPMSIIGIPDPDAKKTRLEIALDRIDLRH